MKLSKKTFWNLLILFEIIFIIKAGISFLQDKPFVFSDEPCVLIRARHFAETFKMATCQEITTIPSGSPQPLLSIIISPLYLFTYGVKAYHGTLIIYSFLLSSLVFPLYYIFRQFTQKNKEIFIAITTLLFLPSIVIFEKMVMTETLFIVINVWFLYFYIKSFDQELAQKRLQNKLLSILFAILATFARPFGFILILAMAVNEIIQSKKKKFVLLIILPVAILLLLYTFVIFMPTVIDKILEKIYALNDPDRWVDVFRAIVAQINSFTFVTYFLPPVVFLTYIFKKDSKPINSIKYYLLTFIILNFIISAQHIFGYYLNGHDPGLLTRYINSSIFLIFMFSAIFFLKYKKFRLNLWSTSLIIIILACLFFFKDESIKLSLNMEMGLYFNSYLNLFTHDTILSKKILSTVFIPLAFILFGLLIKNKRKILISILISIIIFQSIISYIWMSNMTIGHPLANYFAHDKLNIAIVHAPQHDININWVWELIALTNNKVKIILIRNPENPTAPIPIKLELEKFKDSQFFKEADLILTKMELELPVSVEADGIYGYKTHNENNE